MKRTPILADAKVLNDFWETKRKARPARHSLVSLLSAGNQYAASSQWFVEIHSRCASTVARSPARIASQSVASASATAPVTFLSSPSSRPRNANNPPSFWLSPSSSFRRADVFAPAAPCSSHRATNAACFARISRAMTACRGATRDASADSSAASAGGRGHSGAGPTHAPPEQYRSRPRSDMGGAEGGGGADEEVEKEAEGGATVETPEGARLVCGGTKSAGAGAGAAAANGAPNGAAPGPPWACAGTKRVGDGAPAAA